MDQQAKPEEIDLDGHIDAKGIQYIGKARKQPNGKYNVLANVSGSLCRVEVNIKSAPPFIVQ